VLSVSIKLKHKYRTKFWQEKLAETDLSKDLEKVGRGGGDVKMNLREAEWEAVDWLMRLATGTNGAFWLARKLNFRFQNTQRILTVWKTVSFSRRALPCAVC